jgi:hypothetical protein
MATPRVMTPEVFADGAYTPSDVTRAELFAELAVAAQG